MANQRSFVLWGSAGHAKVLAELISLNGNSVVALFDNNDVPSALLGVPVYKGEDGFRKWVAANKDEIPGIAGLVAIGGGRGRDRLEIQRFFTQLGIDTPAIHHPGSIVSKSAKIGLGTQILALANIAAEVQLGDACIVNHRASVDHECKLGNGVHVAPGATLCGCVSVDENVFIGAGAVILPRISIGANSIIGAGAVVTRDILEGEVVIGNPAKPIVLK